LKHFVEFRLRTEFQLEKFRVRLASKDADYMKMFMLISDNPIAVTREAFLKKAQTIPMTFEEANFFFDYFDQAPKNGELSFAEFIRELAPSCQSNDPI
jgi:hypothetical protein